MRGSYTTYVPIMRVACAIRRFCVASSSWNRATSSPRLIFEVAYAWQTSFPSVLNVVDAPYAYCGKLYIQVCFEIIMPKLHVITRNTSIQYSFRTLFTSHNATSSPEPFFRRAATRYPATRTPVRISKLQTLREAREAWQAADHASLSAENRT